MWWRSVEESHAPLTTPRNASAKPRSAHSHSAPRIRTPVDLRCIRRHIRDVYRKTRIHRTRKRRTPFSRIPTRVKPFFQETIQRNFPGTAVTDVLFFSNSKRPYENSRSWIQNLGKTEAIQQPCTRIFGTSSEIACLPRQAYGRHHTILYQAKTPPQESLKPASPSSDVLNPRRKSSCQNLSKRSRTSANTLTVWP